MVTSFVFLVACVGFLGSTRPSGILNESVDLIELNHFLDQNGRHMYDQVIFYEQVPIDGSFRVRAWCLVEDRESLNRRPVHDFQTNSYEVHWYDSEQGSIRCIRSKLFRESWTQHDPERLDKKKFDERLRLALVHPAKKRKSAEDKLAKEAAPDSIISRATVETPINLGQSVAVQKSK